VHRVGLLQRLTQSCEASHRLVDLGVHFRQSRSGGYLCRFQGCLQFVAFAGQFPNVITDDLYHVGFDFQQPPFCLRQLRLEGTHLSADGVRVRLAGGHLDLAIQFVPQPLDHTGVAEPVNHCVDDMLQQFVLLRRVVVTFAGTVIDAANVTHGLHLSGDDPEHSSTALTAV